MHLLSTRIHGVLDYLVGALLIAAPWLLGFARGGPEQWVLVAVGGAALVYSVFTDYELGLVKALQTPLHLWLDAFGGAFLAISPWLFGFDQQLWIPHLAAGVFQMLAALVTNTVPSYERRRAR